MVPAPGVLANDSDSDIPAGLLTALKVANPSHGELLILNATGLFVYEPESDYVGMDAFTYKVFDGTSYSEVVSVNISVYQEKIYLPMLVKPFATPVLELIHVPGSDNYTLSWDPIAGADDYKIWESLTTTFPTDPAYVSGGLSSFMLPDMNPTRYYYQIVATNGYMDSLPSNTLPVDRQYELEPNDSILAANGPIFTTITYYGQIDDDKDYYMIYMDGPATITVTMPSYPSPWDGQLQLFEENTGQVRGSDVTPSDGMQVTYTGETANWYYIYIPTPDNWSSQWYTFTVTITPTP